MFRHSTLATLILFIVGLLSLGCQQAASYPTRPVEYVVHASAGGGTDIMARAIADIMSKEKIVSQPLSVVNKTGGSSTVATAYVAEKKGDPYFIYNITSAQLSAQATGQSKINLSELTPVANLVMDSNCIVVRADSPYKTFQDLADAAKSGKKISQGGGSITSTENLTGYLARKGTGANWEFVSYNSGGEALTALLGGHVDLVIPSPAEVTEQVRAGKMRVLLSNSEKRLDIWPEVPTMKELGLSYPTGIIRGVMMPGGVPAETVKFWEDAFQKMRQTDAWKKYIKDGALIDAWMSSKELGEYLPKGITSFVGTLNEMGLLKK